jgi:hypothetical protein
MTPATMLPLTSTRAPSARPVVPSGKVAADALTGSPLT